MIAEVAGHRCQRAGLALVEVRHIEQSRFDEDLPVLAEPVVGAQHIQARIVLEELGVYPIQADLSESIGVLGAERQPAGEVVRHVDGGNMALLDEFTGNILATHLPRGRHIIEIGVLGHRIEAVVADRAQSVTEYGFCITAVKERTVGAFAVGIVEFAEQPRRRVQLELEAVAEQPGLTLVTREIELFDIVAAVFDATRELPATAVQCNLHAGGNPIGFRAGIRVLQRAQIGIEAERPFLIRREADTGRMGQSITVVAMLVAFLEEHAGTVGEARLEPRDEITFAALGIAHAEVGTFVLERIAEIHARAIGVEVVRAKPAAGAQVTIRDLCVDLQFFGYLVGAAKTGPGILATRPGYRQRVLHEAVDVPVGFRVVTDLDDRVRTLAFVLRQRHEHRVIDALVHPVAQADVPILTELVADIEFLCLGLDAEVERTLVHLRTEGEAFTDRHAERAAIVRRVGQRREPWCRVAGLELLDVQGQARVVNANEVPQAEAEIGSRCCGLHVRERGPVDRVEFEAAVLRRNRQRHEPFAL